MPRLNLLVSLAVLAALALPVAPTVAGPAENALLAKYAGDWRGTGKVTGPDPGTVVCRISLKPAASGKLSYSGRCTYSGQGTASFRGTMLYNDASKRYEAAASAQGVSTTTTVGKKQGGGIVFATSGMDTRYGTVSSVMTLAGNAIKMSFKLIDKDGATTASSINFSKS
jgi:hypothetical protein